MRVKSPPPVVLVVDDDFDCRQIYLHGLRSRGYEVHVASDAIAGMDAARKHRPAVIVLDVMMPGIDGLEAARRLRAEPSTRDMGIVAITASRDPEMHGRARTAGADFFLAKPCTHAELALHVAECIRRRRPRPVG